MSSPAAGSSPLYLSDGELEELCDLTPFPDSWSGVADGADVDQAGRFKFPYASTGTVLAIAPEDLVEISTGTLLEIAERIPVRSSGKRPWVPRGSSSVPNFLGQGVELISVQVPQGFCLWLEAFAFDLQPSQANELNYYWQVRVNGQDVLNTGLTPQGGRPSASAEKVQFGYGEDSKLLAQPGSLVEVSVIALATLGASDTVTAALFGNLEAML